MEVDMFLKLDDIKGESNDAKHKDEIDILTYSLGAVQSATTHTGSGGGAGKVSVKDLSITKIVDKATPNLFLACCSGKHFKEAILTVRKAGEKPLEYLKIVMKQVLISSYSSGNGTESVSFNFAEISMEYVPQKADGSGDATILVGWDIARNVRA